MLLLDKMQDDQLRKFRNPEDARHLGNGITKKAVDQLIQATADNSKLVKKYYAIKRKQLGIGKMYYYDRFAPIASIKHKPVAFAEAASTVQKAFRSFDPQFADFFTNLLKSKHIDAAKAPNKRSGAYCASMPKPYLPYIMLNYAGSLRDIETLAHESGHAIQDILVSKHPFITAHPPLTLAETASVFAEMVLFDDLLAKCKTKKERLALYAKKIEDVFSTIFRQISFVIFEREAHAAIKAKGQLSAAELSSLWLKTQKEIYGDSIAFDENYKYWWSYIYHFYEYPFYVYAYAFGNLVVFALWNQYQQQGSAFVSKYKELLSIGGTRSTMQTLEQFGFDPESREFWDSGFKEVSNLIEKFAELC